MCTMTVIPLSAGRVRIAFNRDERPTRTAALPPQTKAFGPRVGLLPTDPESGGTWLAVNDAALVLAVLNVTPPGKPTFAKHRSRGTIIPVLLERDSPADALARFDDLLDTTDFAPFRLVLVGNGLVADLRWDGRERMVMSRLLGGQPYLFTSSGLGDHLVEGIRREWFDTCFAAPPADWPTVQDEFHRHRWPGREHLSVDMERATARTVSRAVIDLGEGEATFHYSAVPADPQSETVTRLPLLPGGSR
jgi:hypothetical protein